MRVAIASKKRLSIHKKRALKHAVRNNDRLTLPERFDKKMHTLVCEYETLTVTESQMLELTAPDVLFLTYEDFTAWLRSGLIPDALRTRIHETMEARLKSTKISSMFVRGSAIRENEKSIEHHSTEKPMTKALLMKKKLQELKAIAIKQNVNLNIEHGKRLTKSIVAARIIAKMVVDEQTF